MHEIYKAYWRHMASSNTKAMVTYRTWEEEWKVSEKEKQAMLKKFKVKVRALLKKLGKELRPAFPCLFLGEREGLSL